METKSSTIVPTQDNIDSAELSENRRDFLVKFWGVRGSVPTPGKDTVRYGGNTSCIEMQIANNRLIFDGGTGIRELGKELMQEMPIDAYVIFQHRQKIGMCICCPRFPDAALGMVGLLGPT